MDIILANYLSHLEFGKIQRFQNMVVVPLLTSSNHTPKYITLNEALDERSLTVTEVDRSGSVPNLKAINKGEVPILLLDGEELAGAKQNRVLNTTILLRKKSETIIPVSCTEQGRWSYVSPEFSDADVIVSPRLRTKKVASVTKSLRRSRRYEADQGAVWDGIHEMAASARVSSPTGAMRDVFKARIDDLSDYLTAFEYVPHQRGLLVIINGEIAGCDVISLESAYRMLHPKLVKSYAMDASLQRKEKRDEPSLYRAKGFLKESTLSEEKRIKSIGHGWDYRFNGKSIVGSALLYRKKVIHMAFFRTTESGKTGGMSGIGRRRDFRV